MNSQIERIQLQPPEPTLDSLSFCQSTPESVRDWLNQQTKRNQHCFNQLHSALVEISQLKTSSVNRWELIELLRSEVYLLINSILLECKCQQENSDCINQPIRLLRALADCYKAVLSEVSNTSIQVTTDALPASLHRCMTELAQILYLTPVTAHTKGLWREMHQLFQLAVKNDVTRYTLSDSTVIKTRQLSIVDVYKRALLLSKTESFSFQEIKLINKALCLWVPHTRLTSSDKSNSYFIVDLNSDSGLQFNHPSRHSKTGLQLSLDVRVLIAHLRKLKTSSAQQQSSVLPPKLISLLLKKWGVTSQRTFKRYPNSINCQIHLGFEAIYQALSKASKRTEATSVAASLDNSQADSEDIWSSAYDAAPASSIGNANPDSIEFKFSGLYSRKELHPLQAKTVNSSANGYCLIMDVNDSDMSKPGTLIIIQEERQQRWLLGFIRWKKSAQNKLIMGVELTSAEVSPCQISPVTKVSSELSFSPAILASPADKPSPVLFCNEVLQNGMKFFIRNKNETQRGVTKEVFRHNSKVSMINFRLLEEPVLSL
ncbi:hypothetical protein EOPP23_21005 [Endozoicomonas sp. OPT23]|uniref:hypothetical protein n=1 Tax=Endozoicomonas sp. OPT23 TaxID=2072845 RepID=UPI00129B9D90|nr:hypothetical protein [Endozoicomonas sp. OPT23]MRI35443.1 hypothetical protein [Endozoicomonas sp. OPT23]